MEIKVRGLEPFVVTKIDELAKQQKLSREEFLRRYLSNLSIASEVKEQQNQFEEMYRQMLLVIKQNAQVMQRMLSVIEDIEENE